jgi:hypothetical protein
LDPDRCGLVVDLGRVELELADVAEIAICRITEACLPAAFSDSG